MTNNDKLRLCGGSGSDKTPIILIDNPSANKVLQSSDSDIGIVDLEIDVLGEALHTQIAYRNCQATLADVIPMARLLSKKIIQTVLRNLSRNGTPVPCRKGCTECCRHLAICSVPEAFHLVKKAAIMPMNQWEHITAVCSSVTKQVHEYLRRYIANNNCIDDVLVNKQQLKQISDWYFGKKVSCPFLLNDSCAIYEQRPIVCCEHLVTGSSPCWENRMGDVKEVEIPIRIEIALKLMTSKLEQTTAESVILPCIFDWYVENRMRANRTWPAKVLAEHFVEAVYEAQNIGLNNSKLM